MIIFLFQLINFSLKITIINGLNIKVEKKYYLYFQIKKNFTILNLNL